MSMREAMYGNPIVTRRDLEDKIKDLTRELEQSEKERNEAKAKAEAAGKVHDVQKQKWEAETADLKKKLKAAEEAKAKAEQAAGDAERRTKEAETAKAKAEQVLKDAADAKAALEAEIEELKAKLKAVPASIADGKGINLDLSLLTEDQRKELTDALAKVADLREEIQKKAKKSEDARNLLGILL